MQLKFHVLFSGILLATSHVVFSDAQGDAAYATYLGQVEQQAATTQGFTQLSGGLSQVSGGLASGFGQVSSDIQKIGMYLINLGKYFGYDLVKYSETSFSSTLLKPAKEYQDTENGFFLTWLGSLMGGGNSGIPIVSISGSVLNSSAGITYSKFSQPNNSSTAEQPISATPLLDQSVNQSQFQPDPVSQSVLNLLSSPDYTYCTYYTKQNNSQNSSVSATIQNPDCPILFREKIMAGIIPALPATKDVFSVAYNQPIVQQLNSDVFLVPLMYSTDSSQQNSGNSGPILNSSLPAKSQAQQAADFIRYATGTVNPLRLPSQPVYDSLVSRALNYSGQTTAQEQISAQGALSSYLLKLRTYAAQTSVGISNLYYMLSKRMPQKSPGEGSTQKNPSSSALDEFNMATWRLFNSGNADSTSGQTAWLDKIDKASPATVEKEIAVLLAEMNYQLYLTRQQNERLLLTQSILLLQQAQSGQNQPDPDLGSVPESNGNGSTIQTSSSTPTPIQY